MAESDRTPRSRRFHRPSIFLLLALIHGVAARADITVAPANPQVGFCSFFGYGSTLDPLDPGNPGRVGPWAPYGAMVYRNVPAFSVAPGDILAFDLGTPNDYPPSVDIAFAPGQDPGTNDFAEPSTAFVPVVSNTQVPSSGNAVIGDYEVEYTIEQSFEFSGGTLFIRVSNPSAAYQQDNTCTQVAVYGDLGDASGQFVRRYVGSENPTFPWSGAYANSFNNGVVAFRILNTAAPAADLSVSIGGPSSVLVEADFTYTVDYANNGPEDATGVEVVIETPPDIWFVGVEPGAAGCTAGADMGATVTCAIGALASGVSGQIMVHVRAPQTALDRTVAKASIAGIEADGTGTNNTATAEVFVDPLDVEVEDTRFPHFDRNIDFLPATIGETLTESITVHNNGLQPVDFTITEGVTTPFAVVDPNSCDGATIAGSLSCEFSVEFAPTALGSFSDEILVQFSAGSATAIALSGNGVEATADLSLAMSALPTEVVPGIAGSNETTYTLEAGNLGPDTAAVVVTYILPDGVAVAPGSDVPDYDPATGIWTVEALAAGGTAILDIPVTVDAGVPGCLTSTAEAALAAGQAVADPNPLNNETSVRIGAPVCADLVLTTALSDDVTVSLPPINDVSYVDVTLELRAFNAGPSDVASARLLPSDEGAPGFTLSEELCYLSNFGEELGECDVLNSPSTELGQIAAGEQVATALVVRYYQGSANDLAVTYDFTVSSEASDPDVSNNRRLGGFEVTAPAANNVLAGGGGGGGCFLGTLGLDGVFKR